MVIDSRDWREVCCPYPSVACFSVKSSSMCGHVSCADLPRTSPTCHFIDLRKCGGLLEGLARGAWTESARVAAQRDQKEASRD